jgi:hypothetical protein
MYYCITCDYQFVEPQLAGSEESEVNACPRCKNDDIVKIEQDVEQEEG